MGLLEFSEKGSRFTILFERLAIDVLLATLPGRLREELAQGPVAADLAEPDTKWTLADLSETNDPDTGDIYSGLDRFGRVKDNRWYDYGSSVDVDRTKYGYDRASNRIWRQNVVANSLSQPFDELYHYDGVHRLKAMSRGTLNGSHNVISNS
ncbi:hypothetical protein [Blastopirellula marina]|uniref:RHS repeat-associated core domain-containing protein n=1 Tax=Blastopirellula marina TaxID=124 RepID=A0A2S8G8F4_9BACT|nr:hypothetical protein [Blastopirellula marina]PQO40735.1 hypothetical protein C5Y98_05830 [Blastopirellula marina]PTL45695.1 hypothetical protein C5Y97_05830 [Blastopirellula marina]